MKISAFKVGLVLVVIGMIWVSVIFNETEKNHDSVILQKSNSIESKLEFSGIGIGYYKIYMPEFSEIFDTFIVYIPSLSKLKYATENFVLTFCSCITFKFLSKI